MRVFSVSAISPGAPTYQWRFNGVALGTYGASSSYGVSIGANGTLISDGSPVNLNRIVRYNTVQEQAVTNWSASTVAPSVKISSSSASAQFRFTGWSLLGGSGDHGNCAIGHSDPVAFTDCQLGGGNLTLTKTSVNLTRGNNPGGYWFSLRGGGHQRHAPRHGPGWLARLFGGQ